MTSRSGDGSARVYRGRGGGAALPARGARSGLPLKALSADERATLEALTLRTADYLTKNWGGIAA